MNEADALKKVENSLRNFISDVMSEEKVDDWIYSCGISQDRIIEWKKRRETEKKNQKFNTSENRLLYYSDFYDLINIIDKNWDDKFKDALGEKKTILVFLKILNDFRNPDAHRRELFPYQKHLIIGISGEIRHRIVLYRSKKETSKDYFPLIESVRDNFGNSWPLSSNSLGIVNGHQFLRSGCTLTFLIDATDPEGESLEYSCSGITDWQENNVITIEINDKYIGKNKWFHIRIRSKRKYHAYNESDDSKIFQYTVLPEK